MSDSAFATALRVMLCPSCGAPVRAPASGGETVCEHCRSPLEIVARREDPRREVNEAERQAMLRRQRESAAGTTRMPPIPSSMDLAFLRAHKPDERDAALGEASQVLLGLRGVAMGSPSEDQVLELVVAATTLAEKEILYGNHEHARAALESVLDLLPQRDLRDRVRLAIARGALSAGDAAEAASWIEAVDQRPTDLVVDTELRLARALGALREGQYAEAERLLGEPGGQVVFIMGGHPAASVVDLVRAHALVGLGRADDALAALERSAALHARRSLFLEMASLYPGAADGLVPRVAGSVGRGFRVAMIIELSRHCSRRAATTPGSQRVPGPSLPDLELDLVPPQDLHELHGSLRTRPWSNK